MSKKILVVEDDATTADYIAGGLEEKGFVVDRATDGRDGLFPRPTASIRRSCSTGCCREWTVCPC